MFGDYHYVDRSDISQEGNYRGFLQDVKTAESELKQKAKLCIIEIGASNAVPTVRRQSESRARDGHVNATLIRLNLDDAEQDVPTDLYDFIPVKMGALDGLKRIDELVTRLGEQENK